LLASLRLAAAPKSEIAAESSCPLLTHSPHCRESLCDYFLPEDAYQAACRPVGSSQQLERHIRAQDPELL
jgi:hypothetical protein